MLSLVFFFLKNLWTYKLTPIRTKMLFSTFYEFPDILIFVFCDMSSIQNSTNFESLLHV